MSSPRTFLDTAIIPLLHQPENQACGMCMNNFDIDRVAVQIPCGHTACKSCVEGWIGSGHERCAVCRRRLVFKSPTTLAQYLKESAPALVRDALGNAVASFKADIRRGSVARIDSNIAYDPKATLEAAKTLALFIRGHKALPRVLFGIRIDIRQIDAHLLALANIAPAYAADIGKSYTSAQTQHLPMILLAIHNTLQAVAKDRTNDIDNDARLVGFLKASIDAELTDQHTSLTKSGFEAKEAQAGSVFGFDRMLESVVYVMYDSLMSKPLPPTPKDEVSRDYGMKSNAKSTAILRGMR